MRRNKLMQRDRYKKRTDNMDRNNVWNWEKKK